MTQSDKGVSRTVQRASHSLGVERNFLLKILKKKEEEEEQKEKE